MDNDYLKDVGRFVVRKRGEMNGMTQAFCSEKCGMGRSALSDIENGNRLPNGRELLDLSRVLNTSPNEILTAGKDDSDFTKNTLEQETSDVVVSLAKTLFAFSRLSRDNKDLIQKLMLSMAFGDLTPKEQSEFFGTYESIPEKVIDLKQMVSLVGDLCLKSEHPETGKPILSKNPLDTLEDSAKSFYNGGDFGALFGVLISVAPSVLISLRAHLSDVEEEVKPT